MENNDYPCLFQSADKASLSAQKIYISMMRVYYALLVVAAVFGYFMTIGMILSLKGWTCLVLVSLIITVIVRLVIQVFMWDRKWFDTRAVAESAKTATWRYVMGAEPYDLSLSLANADRKFIGELRAILQSRPEVQKCLSTNLIGDQQITNEMRDIRGMSFTNRKEIYLNQRVGEQKKWYATKAKYNGRNAVLWFWIVVVTEILAICVAVYLLNTSNSALNVIGVLTTLAVAFGAWAETRKHRELRQSYALAVQELAAVESLAVHVADDDTLAQYVIDTENAISKEHTMWCAKRS